MRIYLLAVCLFFGVCLGNNAKDSFTIDLGGQWNLKNSNGSIQLIGTVPGDVYGDLLRAKLLREDPYYRFNDVNYRWIALEDWTYSRNFQVPASKGKALLWAEGLDTVASVKINGKEVMSVDNMFARHQADVSSLIRYGNDQNNEIVVSFQNAAAYAEKMMNNYPYPVDSNDPPQDVTNGILHRNFIRKEQSSFSWDWGPAFIPQGIYMPIGLKLYKSVFLNYVVPQVFATSSKLDSFNVNVSVIVRGTKGSGIKVVATCQNAKNVQSFTLRNDGENTFMIPLKVNSPQLWWPRGYGQQNLYDLQVKVYSVDNSSALLDSSNQKIGFRKVELITDPIEGGSQGENWMYFKVNNLPIWAKGSNWIPSDSFESRVNDSNIAELLESSADANMNIVRVWGGGLYQRESFYSTCDRLGLMVWQEFMFACAMYPRDQKFLASVKSEVVHQVRRLSWHPSIVMWSGNNENEAALTWGAITPKNRDLYVIDYSALYYDTIHKALVTQDVTRPFWPSSPSNGYTSLEPLTGIWGNPQDTNRGDVHFYNYGMDCTNVTNFPKAKFVSEYGFQSHDSLETYLPVSVLSDRSRNSQLMYHRQHHPNGNVELEQQVSKYFKLVDEETGDKPFSQWSYLTQCMQSLCIKAQTEHYRRGKGMPQKTMGAIYWQLNSIWQAPTWSSLEYGGRWKMLHHYVKRFFAPVLISGYEENGNLFVHITSDVNTPVNGKVVFSVRKWSGRGETSSFATEFTLNPLESKQILTNSVNSILNGGNRNEYFITFSAYDSTGLKLSDNFHFFSNIKDVDLPAPVISVSSLKQLNPKSIQLTISSQGNSPYTWLSSPLEGRFDDNGILLLAGESRTLTFTSKWNVSVASFSQNLKVFTIKDTY